MDADVGQIVGIILCVLVGGVVLYALHALGKNMDTELREHGRRR